MSWAGMVIAGYFLVGIAIAEFAHLGADQLQTEHGPLDYIGCVFLWPFILMHRG